MSLIYTPTSKSKPIFTVHTRPSTSPTQNLVIFTKQVCGTDCCTMLSIEFYIHTLINFSFLTHTLAESVKAPTKRSKNLRAWVEKYQKTIPKPVGY